MQITESLLAFRKVILYQNSGTIYFPIIYCLCLEDLLSADLSMRRCCSSWPPWSEAHRTRPDSSSAWSESPQCRTRWSKTSSWSRAPSPGRWRARPPAPVWRAGPPPPPGSRYQGQSWTDGGSSPPLWRCLGRTWASPGPAGELWKKERWEYWSELTEYFINYW